MNSTDELRAVLNHAANIYQQRQEEYGDQWRKYGWRGALYNARRKVERAWERWWDNQPETTDWEDVDDLLDTINYCAMTIMEIRRGNRDGEGGWW